ncbi:hypothetical protein [Massilia consociata]|uniref:Membrane protein DUF2306 n=1 Tax=Massilia consociata TaxID=760117 RepID=A0ABV6FM20_9BURK
MSLQHLLNLAAHIATGSAAICLGLALLAGAKGTPGHRRHGRLFAALTLVVCVTGIIGNVFFRFTPVFAVLTLLVAYQLLSGWHVVYTKDAGPNRIDTLLAVCAAAWAIGLVPVLFSAGARAGAAPTVVYSSLGGLVFLLAYDAARWCFPRHWHASLWRYEHIYKLVASLFAMLSAAVGNLVRFGQPWSQLLPSVLGIMVIVVFGWREYRSRRRGHLQTPGAEKNLVASVD